MELLDRASTPTTIRRWAFDLLPFLCELLSKEKEAEISKTDAISIAVREAIERRKQERSKSLPEKQERE